MCRANATTSIAYFLIIAAAMTAAATAQSPGLAPVGAMSPEEAPGPYYPGGGAPPPGLDCFPYLINVSDCLTFVQSDSNLTKPDPGCCPELANLVDVQPLCLCQLLGNSGQFTVDVKRALKLPVVCNVTTPPVSLCAAVGYPVTDLTPTTSPSEAPSPAEEEGATPPSAGSDGGSAASSHHFQPVAVAAAVAIAPLLFFF